MWATWYFVLNFVVLLYLVVGISGNYHKAAHINEIITGVRLTIDSSGPVRRQARKRQPIRITPFFDASITALPPQKRSMIQNQTVPHLINFLSRTLSVDRVHGPILLNRACRGGKLILRDDGQRDCFSDCQQSTHCGPMIIPDNHLKACVKCGKNTLSTECTESIPTGNGIPDADLVIYISAIENKCSQNQRLAPLAVASATACQMESEIDRPIAGNINFCPNSLQGRETTTILDIAKHEVTHALAFSANLFAFWRDPEGRPRTTRQDITNLPVSFNTTLQIYQPSSNTIRQNTQYANWVTRNGTREHFVHHLITPAVLNKARDHFDCPMLEGVELENQGGLGTSLSHWEKRILGNEILTGSLTFNPVFSAITLATFEDSGWYDVNYTMADKLVWGKGAGCSFAMGSCREWMNTQIAKNKTVAPYCQRDALSESGCTVDHQAVSRCNTLNYTFSDSIPLDYQYFTDPSLGGRVPIADYCPFEDIFTIRNQDGTNRMTECSVPANQPSPNLYLEAYGPDSRCILHGTRHWINLQYPALLTASGSGCYKYSCSPEAGVSIIIEDHQYNCTCEGEEIRFDVTLRSGIQYIGSLICPACSEICYDELQNCAMPETPPCHGRIQEQLAVPTENSETTSDNNSATTSNSSPRPTHKLMSMFITTLGAFVTLLWLC